MTIGEKYEKNILNNTFSESLDTNLDLVGIITLKNGNIFFTDEFNNSRKILWNENVRPGFLCSGLVMRIIGKKQMDFGKPTNIIVSDYKFPSLVIKRDFVVTSPIAICHTLSSKDKINSIAKNSSMTDIFIMGANSDKRLVDVLNHLFTISQKKFHFMPGDRDLISTNLPLTFFGFKNHRNVLMKENPHQHEGVLFLNRKNHLEKMITNSNLKITIIEMMKLIYDSKQVFPSGRITRRKEIAHDATLLICDGNELHVEKYKECVLIILPPEKLLILEKNTHRFVNL
tara:strand:- start:8 stop:865 length:858 start_codon:yes stop_codon:yes gene_type:complete